MRIKLRYFASLRERLGKTEEIREIPDGASVGQVWELLTEEHPDLAEPARSIAFAVAEEYVDKDHCLQDNDELAFLPPVSGGAVKDEAFHQIERKAKRFVLAEDHTRILAKLTHNPIDLQELCDFVADPGAGALASFVGTTRNTNEGRQVIRLEYECYPVMAEKEMTKIGRQVLARWPVLKIAMMHRLGRVDIGQASVAIAVSSPRRGAAFEACQHAINTLKETVPIWKKERYEGGQVWIGSQTGTPGRLHQVQQEDRKPEKEERMSAENEKKATDFCLSLEDGELARSVQYLSEDVEYHNMPWEPVSGHAGVRKVLDSFVEGDNNILQKMDIRRTASSGTTVMNERLETWAIGTVTVKLPVVGLFEFNSEGKIFRWHDYFDAKTLAPLTEEMKRVRG